jgi:hypothetical protein
VAREKWARKRKKKTGAKRKGEQFFEITTMVE